MIESNQNREQRIVAIEKRNAKVEQEKARETSTARISLIVVVTYLLITLFFSLTHTSKPRLNALVPSIGFRLSTLTITKAKTYRLQHFYKK